MPFWRGSPRRQSPSTRFFAIFRPHRMKGGCWSCLQDIAVDSASHTYPVTHFKGNIEMAKKEKVNKTQAVRDYLKAHPKAMSREIAAALNKQGIKINAGHVANIKSQINKTRRTKKAAKAKTVEAVTPISVEPTTKAATTVSLEHVKAVALTVKNHGGSIRLYELLDLVKEVGGLKKFKDLLEAISGTPEDDIPF
jgi:hypothetical protein